MFSVLKNIFTNLYILYMLSLLVVPVMYNRSAVEIGFSLSFAADLRFFSYVLTYFNLIKNLYQ